MAAIAVAPGLPGISDKLICTMHLTLDFGVWSSVIRNRAEIVLYRRYTFREGVQSMMIAMRAMMMFNDSLQGVCPVAIPGPVSIRDQVRPEIDKPAKRECISGSSSWPVATNPIDPGLIAGFHFADERTDPLLHILCWWYGECDWAWSHQMQLLGTGHELQVRFFFRS